MKFVSYDVYVTKIKSNRPKDNLKEFKKVIFFILPLILFLPKILFSEINASQVERSQELIQKNEELRKQIESEPRVYIKQVIITGSSQLSEVELSEITSLFQKKWFLKKELPGIADYLSQVYKKKGIPESSFKINYQLKGGILNIQVEETNRTIIPRYN